MEPFDSKKIEAEVRTYWDEAQVPQNLSKHREGAKKFFLLDGPPYVNAAAHVGHVKTTACKDVWTRFKYMTGFDCHLQAGFDCHGLPVEVVVQKELGVTTKQDIERIGIAKFDAACLSKILDNEKAWMDYYRRLGAWRAYFEPYFTYKNYYIESAWWTLKHMHEKGLLREGESPTHWCPKCETVLSGYEVSDSYKDVSDPSVYLKFKAKDADEFFLVWTTTPWTLPANVALFVHPEQVYVRARVNGVTYILAKALVERVFKEKLNLDYEIVEEFKGSKLEGREYEPLLAVDQQKMLGHKAHRVYASVPILKNKKYKKHKLTNTENEEFEEFVTMADGTGIVHCAPGHGSSDYYVGVHYGLPAASPVDEQGKFARVVNGFEGMFVKDADQPIIDLLEREGKLLHAERAVHSYPLCWRCKTPLIFRLSKQWYLSVDYIKEALLENNEKTDWMPAFGKEAFRNWLENSSDWCISRQRYWAIPMPIWTCKNCNRFEVIGSLDELRARACRDPGELTDLHRHSVDSVTLKCHACKGKMTRVPDVFDVWFDSGIAPWASLGYPYKNRELFESMFPVDLINESQDQVRGWFYTLAFAAQAALEKPAFKRVAMMGWVVDEKGEKMSKSQGNVIWAADGIDALGADAIRLYYCWEIAPWDVQKFSLATGREIGRALNVYWNTFQFYKAYAPAGLAAPDAGFKPAAVEDKWICSRVNTLAREVAAHLEAFEFHHAGRKLVDFILNDYSRWYVKLARDRASVGDAEAARTMRYVLDRVNRLLAPICPFVTEKIHLELGGKESVHYASYPTADAALVDSELEELMVLAQRATEASHALRKDANHKLRWPLRKLSVSGEKAERLVSVLGGVLANANNALAVEYDAAAAGKDFDGGAVAIDSKMDARSKQIALLREVSRAVQASRKENGFNVADRIRVEYSGPELAGLAESVGALEAECVKAPKGEHEVRVEIPELGDAVLAKYSKA